MTITCADISPEEMIELAFGYVQEPFSEKSRQIFTRLIAPIKNKTILELGCGANGYFWALGYVQRAQSITFCDRSQLYLDCLKKNLNQLCKAKTIQSFSAVLSFLKNKKLVDAQATIHELAKQILMKSEFVCYDFVCDKPLANKYDYIVMVESIACVQDQDELNLVLAKINKMLNKTGTLNAIWTPYIERNELTKILIKEKIDGQLNPNISHFEKALKKNGLRIVQLEQDKSAPLEGCPENYPHPIFIIAEKP